MSMMDDEAPPTLFMHVCRVYEEMRKRAVPQKDDDGRDILVYEGFFTGLHQDLGLAVPQYTRVNRHLKAMGCVRQLRRGGGAAMSRWQVIKEPNFIDFEAASVQVDAKVPATSRASLQEQMISDLTSRLDDLEEWRDRLMQALSKGELGGQLG